MMNLSPDQLLALSKFKLPKGTRDDVEPGEYVGSIDVTLDYSLTVGADYEQRLAPSVPWMKLAAILFSKINDVTVESVVREALALDDEACTAVKAQASEAIGTLMDKTKKVCKGKVTGTVEVVG